MLPRGGRGGAAAAGGIGASQGDDDDIHDGDTIEMINLQAVKQETVLKILLVGGKQVVSEETGRIHIMILRKTIVVVRNWQKSCRCIASHEMPVSVPTMQGKTSFIRRFADKPFLRQYVPTVGFDLIVIPVFYAGRKVSHPLVKWETCIRSNWDSASFVVTPDYVLVCVGRFTCISGMLHMTRLTPRPATMPFCATTLPESFMCST